MSNKTPISIMDDVFRMAVKIVQRNVPQASDDAKAIAASNLSLSLFSYIMDVEMNDGNSGPYPEDDDLEGSYD